VLLTEEIETSWHKSNKEWYINKGYAFTKMKDKIKVKVYDLPRGSGVVVDVLCDNCGCRLKPKWYDYNNHKHDDKYFCVTCSKKIFGNKKFTETRLKNGKSFEQWCIENSRQDILDRWDYELNSRKPSEITFSNGKKYYFKCPKGVHDSELKNISSITSHPTSSIISGCVACSSIGQYLIDSYGNNAVDLYWDFNLNKESPYKIMRASKKPIWIKCQKKDYHDSYKTTPVQFTLHNHRCPYCSNNSKQVHPLESLGKVLEDKGLLRLWSNKNEKTSYKYTPFSAQKVWWKCPDGKHADYKRKISDSNKCKFRCPDCVSELSNSILQEKVLALLHNFDYTVLNENKCSIIPKNPKTKMSMLFDNEIKELKLIIEVHGEQHYKKAGWHISKSKLNNTTPEYELYYQKLKDRYKRFIAFLNGYSYLEIPYWMDDDKNTWRIVINNKIDELKNKNKLLSA